MSTSTPFTPTAQNPASQHYRYHSIDQLFSLLDTLKTFEHCTMQLSLQQRLPKVVRARYDRFERDLRLYCNKDKDRGRGRGLSGPALDALERDVQKYKVLPLSGVQYTYGEQFEPSLWEQYPYETGMKSIYFYLHQLRSEPSFPVLRNCLDRICSPLKLEQGYKHDTILWSNLDSLTLKDSVLPFIENDRSYVLKFLYVQLFPRLFPGRGYSSDTVETRGTLSIESDIMTIAGNVPPREREQLEECIRSSFGAPISPPK